MEAFSGTVAASNARRVLQYGVQRGLPPREVTAPRIPVRAMYATWADMARRLDDPALPIGIAHGFELEQLGLLGFTVLTAPTLEDGLRAFARYASLLNDGRRWSIAASPRRLVIRLFEANPRDLGARLSHEAAIAQLVHAIRTLGGPEPHAVRFAHRAPRRAVAHRALFRCELEFDAEVDEVVYPRAPFDGAPPAASPALWQYLCAQADAEVASLAPRPLVDRVRDAIDRAFAEGRAPEMALIAATLGATERTLRRALAGRSFRSLVDDARRDRARAALATEAPITRIAFDAGFSDASAFTHACRRWFGQSPSELRSRGPATGRGATRRDA